MDIAFRLSIQHLMDIWVVPPFLLLTFVYKCFDVFISRVCVPRSRIVGLDGNCLAF